MAEHEHLGYYKHGQLPHLDVPKAIQFVTFVLADAAPRHQQHGFPQMLNPDGESLIQLLDMELDRGRGSCLLCMAEAGALVRDAIMELSGRTHQPIVWVVMPNHVHLLTRQLPDQPLGKVVNQIKSGSARRINRLLGREGKLWQRGYFDRMIRDYSHLQRTIDYIHTNPVKAGLVVDSTDWMLSSIHEYRPQNLMQLLQL